MNRLQPTFLLLTLSALVPACAKQSPTSASTSTPGSTFVIPESSTAMTFPDIKVGGDTIPASDTIPAPRPVPPAAEVIDAEPANALNVLAIVGENGTWTFQHPSGKRERNELHLPVSRAVKFSFSQAKEGSASTSGERFEIPAFPLTASARAGLDKTTVLKTIRAGAFALWNSRERIGTAFVTETSEYERFVKNDGEKKPPVEGDGSLAFKGRQLFLKNQCINCHSATTNAKAPALEGLFGTKVALKDGGAQLVDEAYLVESIRKPRVKVVDGWVPIMPAYNAEQISDEDMNAVVAYIKSLKTSTTPKVQPTPPPTAPTVVPPVTPPPVTPPVNTPTDRRPGPQEVVGRREPAADNGIRRAPQPPR
ncbi:Cytochrome c oxidase subunit 2 precursor [Gemmata sp. SH-PL17]|uniref:c-type cytochrome n=1 Tax=Gemmata sp. SH-PL17 TaxID=1630693 RepID=UPI00078C6D34|nr:c-type cytochrome [Gemmata sp. SH-PL17]AMV26685.1 Cytochrome c oxidase subunit 2 precursor [Gemmata sp. SH-PL17]